MKHDGIEVRLNKKGAAMVFFGFGTLLLIAVILYVVIAILSPDTGNQITAKVADLASAAQGVKP